MKIAITPVTSVIIVLIESSENQFTVLGWELEVLACCPRGSGAEVGSLAVLQSGADVSYAQQEFVLREAFPGKTAGRKNAQNSGLPQSAL